MRDSRFVGVVFRALPVDFNRAIRWAGLAALDDQEVLIVDGRRSKQVGVGVLAVVDLHDVTARGGPDITIEVVVRALITRPFPLRFAMK